MTKNLPRLRLSKSTPDFQRPPPEPSAPADMNPRPHPTTSLKELRDLIDTVGRGTPPVPPHKTDGESCARKRLSKRVAFIESPEETPSVLLSLPTVPTHTPESTEKHEQTKDAASYTKPFCDFLTNNPTVYHTVSALASDLKVAGFMKLSERDAWKLERGGKYYVERNGSSMIAFVVGGAYEPGNGVAMLAGHVDALCLKVKPIPKLSTKAGFLQLGVAPYAGALNSTWWDRDLGIGGRVLVKESSGKVVSKLVMLPWPIAKIPTLAPHFGAPSQGPFNKETQMVPIIGLDNSDSSSATEEPFSTSCLGGAGSFTSTQPPRLVKAIAGELSVTDYSRIINWDLELFDTQPATTGGLDHELLFGGRIDDKICSWAALQALINASSSPAATSASGIIQLVGLFDDEEIGSLLRQGARSNFMPSIVERIVDSFSSPATPSLISRTFANSFLVSSDVTHAVNPNFLNVYMANHAPRLNVGIAIAADSNGHMTTDGVSTAILTAIAERCGQKLQVFQIRNDSRSGGTVGPMLSAAMGCRAIDAGIPQLSMHSIRATVGALDPGLGVLLFQGFLGEFEDVDREFRDDN
jgi:aminopeptidase I